MPSRIECPEPQRPLKRSFVPSFDGSDSKSLQPTKRLQQLPSTPRHSLDNDSRPSCSQATPPSLPEPSRLSRKRTFVDIDPASDLVLKKSRLEGWLEEVPESPPTPTCISSCPPRLENSNPPKTIDIGGGQQLSFDVIQEMSLSQRPSFGPGSAVSGRSSRLTTSHGHYRNILRNNGLWIDHIRDRIPSELRTFLDTHILKERLSKLSSEAIDEAINTAIEIADSPECNVYSLTETAILPIKRVNVGRGGNTPWYTDGLPRNEVYSIPLAAAKADIHLGYPTNHKSYWKIEENAVVDTASQRQLLSFLCVGAEVRGDGRQPLAGRKPSRWERRILRQCNALALSRGVSIGSSVGRGYDCVFGLRHPSDGLLLRALLPG